MNIINRTEQDMYRINEQPIAFFGKIYPRHSVTLTKKITIEYEEYTSTEMVFTVDEIKEDQ